MKLKNKTQYPQVVAPKKGESEGSKPDTKEESKEPDHSVLLAWLQFCKEAWRKKHWEYFVIDQFLKGNHDIRGNPSDNTIEIAKKTDKTTYPINKIYSTFRAVRAFVTRNKPIVEIDPEDLQIPDAADYARKANKVIERDNQINNGRRLNKEWVYYGVKFGVGYRQIGYDVVKKCCIRWTVSPWDFLIGSKTGEMEDAPYVIKTFVRTIEYWRKKYPKAEVVPDNKLSDDEYQELSAQLIFDNTGASTQPMDQQTAVGYECWYKVYEENSLGGTVNKCIFTKTTKVSFEETPYDEFPFIPYKVEIAPNESAPDGHLKHVIAPQRMLNLLNMQMLEYNHIVNHGRFLMDKNSGFSVIYAKEGQIIRKNAGKSVEVLNPPALNPALEGQIQASENYIEDIGGQHDASSGVTPARVSSGNAIEALQQGDSNNISDLRDNFEDALSQEASWILKMYDLFEADGVLIKDQPPEAEQQVPVGIVGGTAYQRAGKAAVKDPQTGNPAYFNEDNGTYCDVCTLLPDHHVKVSVNSALGETKAARLDLLFKLVDAGLPLKFLLENLEFPNTSDILQRIAEESVADMMQEQLAAKMTAPPPMGAPGGPTPPPSGPPPNAVPVQLPPQGNQMSPDQIITHLKNIKNKL